MTQTQQLIGQFVQVPQEVLEQPVRMWEILKNYQPEQSQPAPHPTPMGNEKRPTIEALCAKIGLTNYRAHFPYSCATCDHRPDRTNLIISITGEITAIDMG